MTELQFENKGDYFEAEYVVNADFNLHVERSVSKPLVMFMSTVEDANGKVAFSTNDPIVDEDFDAVVYPKYIRVRSFALPTRAYITEAE